MTWHVAVVAPEFPPEIGGMQTYALEFARELAARGVRVTVLTRRGSPRIELIPGVEVRPVLVERAERDLAHFREVSADAWHVMNAAYAWVAIHFRPTVVSVHGNDFLRPYIPVGRPDLSRLPGLWKMEALKSRIEHGIEVWRTPRLMRRGFLRSAQILANSCYTERVFLELFPECKGRARAAMVGVGARYLDAPSEEFVSNEVPQIITVARLADGRKNVDLVLRALAVLRVKFAFHYTVVGDGVLRSELESLVVSLGLQGRVTFTGFVDAEALRVLLMRSDLFVLTAAVNPASHEGFGIAYLEANACGTPTLAARLAGAAEAVDEGVSGYFTEGLEVEQVAAALRRFLSGDLRFDPQACRAFARRFTWARVVDEALPWYGTTQGSALRPAHAAATGG